MSDHQLELIEDPPPKSPYFTKADVLNFLTAADLAQAEEAEKSQYNSLIDLFGLVEKMSDDQQTQFILQLLKFGSFTPDFEAAAVGLNVANAHHVHRRFKTILEKQGFLFDEADNGIKGIGKLSSKMKPKKASRRSRTSAGAQNSRKGKSGGSKRARDEETTGQTNDQPKKKKARLGLVVTEDDGTAADSHIIYTIDDPDTHHDPEQWTDEDAEADLEDDDVDYED